MFGPTKQKDQMGCDMLWYIHDYPWHSTTRAQALSPNADTPTAAPYMAALSVALPFCVTAQPSGNVWKLEDVMKTYQWTKRPWKILKIVMIHVFFRSKYFFCHESRGIFKDHVMHRYVQIRNGCVVYNMIYTNSQMVQKHCTCWTSTTTLPGVNE